MAFRRAPGGTPRQQASGSGAPRIVRDAHADSSTGRVAPLLFDVLHCHGHRRAAASFAKHIHIAHGSDVALRVRPPRCCHVMGADLYARSIRGHSHRTRRSFDGGSARSRCSGGVRDLRMCSARLECDWLRRGGGHSSQHLSVFFGDEVQRSSNGPLRTLPPHGALILAGIAGVMPASQMFVPHDADMLY